MINGVLLKNAIISASNNIENKKQEINDLNVFPVPDGDTGTNMSLTMQAAARDLAGITTDDLYVVADKCASSLLKGARGNSGVILSLLFRGIAKELLNTPAADSAKFSKALNAGVKSAYSAVMKPTEGTMLTVARVSAEQATIFSKKETEFAAFFAKVLDVAKDTLDKTPTMLPILKQANVVDAGGMGIVAIYEGMLSVFAEGKIIEIDSANKQSTAQKADFASYNTEDIEFAYCTEFIINKGKKYSVEKLTKYLHTLGDSVVCVEDTDIIKVHIHTNNPGKVLEEAIKNGDLCRIKIDNMKEQNEEISSKTLSSPAEPTKKIGIVAVCAGSGISAVFRDLGADVIVEGGQTMNPSTDDIISAVNSVAAESVVVFPNNKNIIMAANQAAEIYTSKKIYVIPTKTIPQGISALLGFMPEETVEKNINEMTDLVANVRTGQITFAARDSVFDGNEIKEGEILGLIEGKIAFVEKEIDQCVSKIASNIVTEDTSFLTIFYGDEITEQQANDLSEKLSKDIKCEINVIYGGQPVYYYILSAE